MVANPNSLREAAWRAAQLACQTILLVGFSLAAIGCGSGRPPMARVQGKVLYGGKPLESGVVTFQPDAGPVAIGEIQPDGTFRLVTEGKHDGAVLGHHKVAVVRVQMPDAKEFAKNPKAEHMRKPLIPEKYFDVATSGLTAEVKAQNEPMLFELRH